MTPAEYWVVEPPEAPLEPEVDALPLEEALLPEVDAADEPLELLAVAAGNTPW